MYRNADAVIDALFVTGDSISTSKDLWAYIPISYASKGLAYIGSDVMTLGVMLLTTDNVNYAVSMCTTMLDIVPTKIDTVKDGEVEFYRFFFSKGSKVISNRFPKKILAKVNDCFDYFYGYGHSPWWMTLEDLAMLLSDTVYWNDLRIHNSQVTLDVLASQVCRNPDNVRVFLRHIIKNVEDARKPATTIPLRNGTLNRSSRMTLLSTSELKRGIRGAMLNEPVREEFLEGLFMS